MVQYPLYELVTTLISIKKYFLFYAKDNHLHNHTFRYLFCKCYMDHILDVVYEEIKFPFKRIYSKDRA
jgi:hypothetical protein